MTQPIHTYKPLVLTAHKNCVAAHMQSLSSRHHSSSRPLVSTNGMPASSFLLRSTLTTTNNAQNVTTTQQCSMDDTAITVVEEQQEHIFRSRFSPVSVPDDVTMPEFVLAGAEAYVDKVALVEATPGGQPTPTVRWPGTWHSLPGRCGQWAFVRAMSWSLRS
jgi:4-coumarate--CoA ligase